MKKWAVYFIIGMALGLIVYNACQSVLSVVSKVGQEIPGNLVESRGYERHLTGTLQEIDSYNLEQLKQRYKEDTEFKLKYLRTLQATLERLQKVGQVGK